MSGKIFFSYRRSDTKAYTHVVAQPLMNHFGEDQVFLDVYDIELGRDFVEVLEEAVSSCDVLLAMIGPGWLNAVLPDGEERRLDDPLDFVRIEIATALQRNIRVIPVLVQEATMPTENDLPEILKPLSRRQALSIGDRPGQDIEYQLIPALQRALSEALNERQSQESSTNSPGDEVSQNLSSEGYGYAYVISPKGRQKDRDGNWIDFDQVYQQIIKPAVQKAELTPIRADEEALYYDISPADQIQYLLSSYIVIADISIHDAETYYQLGLRHAFRKRGVIHINSSMKNVPLRIMDISSTTYFLTKNGLPDPREKNVDVDKLYRAIQRSFFGDQYAINSPVFDLLIGLDEPDRKSLRTPFAIGYWREYNLWKERATVAQRQKRVGDIFLLTDEIINPEIKEEAISETIKVLQSLGRYELALEQCRNGLGLNSNNLEFRREETFFLNRLGRADEAIVKLESLIQEFPNDTEAIAYLGRIYKDLWYGSWDAIQDKEDRINEAYKSAHWLVRTVNIYLNAYKNDINNYYPGINAATLGYILDHLAKKFEETSNPEIDQIRKGLPALKGALQFTLENIAGDDIADYWSLISLAELRVASADDIQQVIHAYQQAMPQARKNRFFLQSSTHQLDMLESLDFRPEFVAAGKQVIQGELETIVKDEDQPDEASEGDETTLQNIFVLSGQPLDKPDQLIPVFPPVIEAEARKRIDQVLAGLVAASGDVAVLTGASAGADLLFCEAAQEIGMQIEILLPYPEDRYIQDQIAPAGDDWVDRYYQIRNQASVSVFLQEECLGPPKPGDDPVYRNARWGVLTAQGKDRTNMLRGILLWDGRAVDGTYGAVLKGIRDDLRECGALIKQIDFTRFDYFTKPKSKQKTTEK